MSLLLPNSSSLAKNPTSDGAVGGLCHLMEAATALSKLVEVRGEQVKGFEQAASTAQPTLAPANTSVNISDDDDESCRKNGIRCSSIKREIFPQRLLAILSDSSLTDIVTWLPQGRSFVIVRPDVFTEQVLPKYLPPVDARGSTKYPSFTRKLNRWYANNLWISGMLQDVKLDSHWLFVPIGI
jgi:HSF-type DNA-binding